ncbi:MAG: hypothetical protein CMH63_02550 [Nanoarchaeota archaeon]|nr:hypothetical protein [Nanoarchaeota archaeon]|tara:strand:- start:8262 stop:8534 length:273 start_codon:yes stop_codon:yes gene_type:complete
MDSASYILEKLGLGESEGDEEHRVNLDDLDRKTLTIIISKLDDDVLLTLKSLTDLTKDQKNTIHAPRTQFKIKQDSLSVLTKLVTKTPLI